MTYLRLYRLDLTENKPAEAAEYLKSAQREILLSGFKGDASTETWANTIATREAWEAKHYNNVDVAPVASDSERKPLESTR